MEGDYENLWSYSKAHWLSHAKLPVRVILKKKKEGLAWWLTG